MENIDRINLIFNNEAYKKNLNKNNKYEKHREFCHHNLEHFLDVARICYIIVLENHISIPKDIIYSAALLHDIGKWKQYEYGIPHEEASAEIAIDILQEANFNDHEIQLITEAIRSHRRENNNSELSYLLYKSDKLSRKCYSCIASYQCNWSNDKKNSDIIY